MTERQDWVEHSAVSLGCDSRESSFCGKATKAASHGGDHWSVLLQHIGTPVQLKWLLLDWTCTYMLVMFLPRFQIFKKECKLILLKRDGSSRASSPNSANPAKYRFSLSLSLILGNYMPQTITTLKFTTAKSPSHRHCNVCCDIPSRQQTCLIPSAQNKTM